ETSIKPKTGVVHQNVDGQPTRIKPGFQFSAGGGLCKIQSFDDDVDATALPKLLGQFLHRFCATRNEYEGCTPLRQKGGDLDAESTVCTGNEGPLAAYVVHHSLLAAPQQNVSRSESARRPTGAGYWA